MTLARWQSWIQGPKSAKVPEFMRKLALSMGVRVELTTERRWFTETVFFTVTGTRPNVEKYQELMRQALHEHNAPK